jgi:hypothetical protein
VISNKLSKMKHLYKGIKPVDYVNVKVKANVAKTNKINSEKTYAVINNSTQTYYKHFRHSDALHEAQT